MPISWEYHVHKGDELGVVLTPHKYRNGMYRASKSKFGPHFEVPDIAGVKEPIDKGHSIRMSNPDSQNHRAPSLIKAQFIRGIVY
jgi:hypothetical protein